MDSAVDDNLGRVLATRYCLTRLIGQGAMGAVFEANDAETERAVALKIIHPHLVSAPELEARFLREAKIAQQLDAKHVVPAIDAGRDAAGSVFMVMPLMTGFDVAELLQRTGPVQPELALKIAIQACRGIISAQAQGVIHRDIKPSNLFLDIAGSAEVTVRVTDFGIAKQTDMYDDTHLTRTGSSLGSPLYMSPEQVRDPRKVDHRADIWSLSATVYELLTGTPPHGDVESLAELLLAIVQTDPVWLQDRAAWVSAPIAEAVHQGLSREVGQRYQTTEALLETLEGLTEGAAEIRESELVPVPEGLRNTVAARSDGSPDRVGLEAIDYHDTLIGSVIADKYTLLRLLGRGGMGAVYEANTPDGDQVAIKLITREKANSDSSAQRFTREARASTAIDSDYVVKTVDAGFDPQTGAPFIVMERLHGVDLATLLERKGALVPSSAAKIFLHAARGVAAAHAKGIVHRDIKPANIFIAAEQGTGNVTAKVCDFGVAKRLEIEGFETAGGDLTKTGGMLGSPLYMSPEQVKNSKNVDYGTDVWSLGVAFHQVLSGRRPWPGREELGELILAICTSNLEDIQDIAPWVGPDLAATLAGMVAHDRGQRFSIDEVIERLEAICSGDTALTFKQIGSVDLATRQHSADRVSKVGGTITASSVAVSSARPRRVSATWGWLTAAAIAVVGGVLLVASRNTEHPAAATAAVAPPVQMVTASVGIVPSSARAFLDGAEVPVVDGELTLDGPVGEAISVELRHGSDTGSFTVVLARDGSAAPSTLELQLEPPLVPTPPPLAQSAEPEPETQLVPGPTPMRGAQTGAAPPAQNRPQAPAAPRPAQAKPALGPMDSWQE